ncbi:MAG: hypothetical protein ACPHRO_12660 [Nannocystaceae bacterium]
MASETEITRNKRKRRHQNAGRDRKRKMSQASTASYDQLFAGCGAPGEAAPKAKSGDSGKAS